MNIKKVLTGVLSIGIAATLAACSGDTEDQDEMMENPPETEIPNTGETNPGMDSDMEEEEPASDFEPGSDLEDDAEDPNAEPDEGSETEDPGIGTDEESDSVEQ